MLLPSPHTPGRTFLRPGHPSHNRLPGRFSAATQTAGHLRELERGLPLRRRGEVLMWITIGLTCAMLWLMSFPYMIYLVAVAPHESDFETPLG